MHAPIQQRWHWLHLNPLVPAAVAVVAGVTLGRICPLPIELILIFAGTTWALWIAAELILPAQPRVWIAHAGLLLAFFFAGTALWQLDQNYVEQTALVRLIPDNAEIPVSLHVQVIVPPDENSPSHGNQYWIAQVRAVLSNDQWLPSAGDIRVKSQAGQPLARGDTVEIVGWARLPESAVNPGAFDLRRYLAASRIFVEVKANKAGQVTLLETAHEWGIADSVRRMRSFLRAKLIEHTTRVDEEAANSMVALLLGYRDPSIADVSQSFAAAGVAHLLAISGSHIVFFAGLMWGIMRLLPLRPRVRLLFVGLLVGLYILATPCGPPVLRAGVAMAMLVISRLMARRASLLNMLAAALLVILALRPTDLLDAGAQLSFVSTAGLILLAERCYTLLTGQWMRRREEIASLAASRWPTWELRAIKTALGLIVANFIGALTAMPLVMFHFNSANPLAIVSGLIMLPIVSITMAASLLQLLASMFWSPFGAFLAPLTARTSEGMVWIVQRLAEIPGASVAVRSPPVWIVLAIYAAVILWAMRRWLKIQRATLCVIALAAVVMMLGWYTFTMPVGELRMQVLEVGRGSAVVVRMPKGGVWVVNAGSQDWPDVMRSAVMPVLRVEGVGRLDGVIATKLDTVHAGKLGAVVERYRPRDLVWSQVDFDRTAWTLAGTQLRDMTVQNRTVCMRVREPAVWECEGVRVRVLWPPLGGEKLPQTGLISQWEYAGQKVLLVDASEEIAWGALVDAGTDLRSDVVVLLGPVKAEVVERLVAVTGGRVVRGGRVVVGSMKAKG